MKKKIITRIIFLILILGTCIMIFGFSNQNGQESEILSKKVMKKIIDIYPRTKKLSEEEKNIIVNQSQKIIRKTAHFTIYMVLGIMMTGFFNTYKMKFNKKIIIIIGIGFIYAISDEIHQAITGGGRTPKIFDVLIDTLGTTTGSLIIFGSIVLFKKYLESLQYQIKN